MNAMHPNLVGTIYDTTPDAGKLDRIIERLDTAVLVISRTHLHHKKARAELSDCFTRLAELIGDIEVIQRTLLEPTADEAERAADMERAHQRSETRSARL